MKTLVYKKNSLSQAALNPVPLFLFFFKKYFSHHAPYATPLCHFNGRNGNRE
jgi:hypothetical protein